VPGSGKLAAPDGKNGPCQAASRARQPRHRMEPAHRHVGQSAPAQNQGGQQRNPRHGAQHPPGMAGACCRRLFPAHAVFGTFRGLRGGHRAGAAGCFTRVAMARIITVHGTETPRRPRDFREASALPHHSAKRLPSPRSPRNALSPARYTAGIRFFRPLNCTRVIIRSTRDAGPACPERKETGQKRTSLTSSGRTLPNCIHKPIRRIAGFLEKSPGERGRYYKASRASLRAVAASALSTQ